MKIVKRLFVLIMIFSLMASNTGCLPSVVKAKDGINVNYVANLTDCGKPVKPQGFDTIDENIYIGNNKLQELLIARLILWKTYIADLEKTNDCYQQQVKQIEAK